MRIAIDYSAAVNQRAGIGRLVRNQVLALAEVDHDNDYRPGLRPLQNRRQRPSFRARRNFGRREVRLRERWLTMLWHRPAARCPPIG